MGASGANFTFLSYKILSAQLVLLFSFVVFPLNPLHSYMATEAQGFPKINDRGTGSGPDNPIQKDSESSEITEELASRHSMGGGKTLSWRYPQDHLSILAFEGSLPEPRTLSPKGKKISSLPVTPIAKSNMEYEHGGNIAFPATHVKKDSNYQCIVPIQFPFLPKMATHEEMFTMVMFKPYVQSPTEFWACYIDDPAPPSPPISVNSSGLSGTKRSTVEKWLGQLNLQHGSQEVVPPHPSNSSAATHQAQTDA
ncbi:hypothetical protein VNO77_17615 [Canavalia gladiata]|uniref:Uncharacterized protein n=1 Tax=Canavalia gladiata TaxID=3824 RepID=A0AAN9LN30_CANGL